MGEAKIDHLRVPAGHVHGDETVLWLPSFLSLESCCFESAWNNHYHELGTERAICLIQVCVCVCVCGKFCMTSHYNTEGSIIKGQ